VLVPEGSVGVLDPPPAGAWPVPAVTEPAAGTVGAPEKLRERVSPKRVPLHPVSTKGSRTAASQQPPTAARTMTFNCPPA
jgi:hypothetical protein